MIKISEQQTNKERKRQIPQVVNCKDCKYYATNTELLGDVCNRLFTVFPMKPDDFCSYGEKKLEHDL